MYEFSLVFTSLCLHPTPRRKLSNKVIAFLERLVHRPIVYGVVRSLTSSVRDSYVICKRSPYIHIKIPLIKGSGDGDIHEEGFYIDRPNFK